MPPEITHESPLPTSGICHRCKHLDPSGGGVGMRCTAFPYGIPFAIRAGVVDHRKPHAGDRGIQFEEAKAGRPLTRQEAGSARSRRHAAAPSSARSRP